MIFMELDGNDNDGNTSSGTCFCLVGVMVLWLLQLPACVAVVVRLIFSLHLTGQDMETGIIFPLDSYL